MENSLTETHFYAAIIKVLSSFNRSDNNNHFDFIQRVWENETKLSVHEPMSRHTECALTVTLPWTIKSSFGNILLLLRKTHFQIVNFTAAVFRAGTKQNGVKEKEYKNKNWEKSRANGRIFKAHNTKASTIVVSQNRSGNRCETIFHPRN